MWCIYPVVCYTATGRTEALTHATMGMNLGVLHERSQIPKATHRVILLKGHVQSWQVHRDRKQPVVASGSGQREWGVTPVHLVMSEAPGDSGAALLAFTPTPP